MIELAILMSIFSGCVFLYGLYVSISKSPYLPIKYLGRRDKEYLNYFGKCIMLVALCPLLTAIAAFTDNIIITGIVFVVSLVLCLVVAVKWNKKVEK